MKKNVSGQKIGCQMVSATDGSAFTSAVTVAVTLDAGTQATGTVGSGACTHEGNGYHTYAPSQAETNGDLVAFTFTGSGAVPATVQIFTSFPQTGDNYARIGAPVGASISADIAAVQSDTDNIQTRIPAALVSGRMDASVGAYQSGLAPLQPTTAGRTLDVTATGEAGIDWANVGSPTTTVNLSGTTISTSQAVASVSGAVGSVTGNVGGNVVGSVGSVTTVSDKTGYRLSATGVDDIWDEAQSGHATAGTFGLYLDAAVSGVSTGGVSAADIADAVWDEALSGHTSAGTAGKALGDIDTHTDTETGAAAIRAAIGLASANLDTQLSTIDDFLDTEIAAIKAKTDNLPSDPADASDIAASFTTVNTKLDTIDDFLDTEIAAIKAKTDNLPASPAATSDIPSAASIADAVLDEALSGHTTAGSLGKAVSDIDTHTDTETGAAAIRAAVGLASANLDTQLAAKAEPGDAMALVADALDASAVADSGKVEIAGAVVSAATATPLASNVKKINDVPLTGTGVLGDEWGP